MPGRRRALPNDMAEIPLKTHLEDKLGAVEKRLDAKIDALERLLVQKSIDQDRAVAQALVSAKEAVTKAEVAMGERLALLNESRRTIGDQAALMLTRNEYASGHKELTARLDQIEKVNARAAGQQSVWIAIGVALLSLGGVIYEHVVAK